MRRGVSNASHRCRTNQGIDERRKPKPSPPCRENRRETKHNKRVAVRQKRALHYVAVETCGFFRRFRRLHYRKKEFLSNNFHQNKPFIRLFCMFNCRFFQYNFKHDNKKGLLLQSFFLYILPFSGGKLSQHSRLKQYKNYRHQYEYYDVYCNPCIRISFVHDLLR